MSATTSELLSTTYPPLVTQTQLAEIFQQHVQTIRRAARERKLPFTEVPFPGREKLYRLSDVIEFLENPTPPQPRRGRPVGSKNKNVQ